MFHSWWVSSFFALCLQPPANVVCFFPPTLHTFEKGTKKKSGSGETPGWGFSVPLWHHKGAHSLIFRTFLKGRASKTKHGRFVSTDFHTCVLTSPPTACVSLSSYQRKYPYKHVANTLCQPPTRAASETQYFFVDVSTLSSQGTNYQLRVSRVESFTLQWARLLTWSLTYSLIKSLNVTISFSGRTRRSASRRRRPSLRYSASSARVASLPLFFCFSLSQRGRSASVAYNQCQSQLGRQWREVRGWGKSNWKRELLHITSLVFTVGTLVHILFNPHLLQHKCKRRERRRDYFFFHFSFFF